MRKRIVKFGLFVSSIIGIGLFSGCAEQPLTDSISVIGDSISNGHRLADPWPPMLERALGIPVSNNSISGEKTEYGLSIVHEVIEKNRPKYLIVMLGTNDAVFANVPDAIDNLQELVDIINSYGIKPIVATLPPVTNPRIKSEKFGLISQGIRGLKGASIVDVREEFNKKANGQLDSLFADGIHPNNSGQKLIADTFIRYFQSL